MPSRGSSTSGDDRRIDCAIRRAAMDDLETLADLESEAFERPWSPGQLRDELLEVRATIWLAECEARAVGYLSARCLAPEAEILKLAVVPARRRQGLGRALVLAALDSLSGRGVERVHLEVGASNGPARELYSGLGFRPLGARPAYYAGREDALTLCLELATGTSQAPAAAGPHG